MLLAAITNCFLLSNYYYCYLKALEVLGAI